MVDVKSDNLPGPVLSSGRFKNDPFAFNISSFLQDSEKMEVGVEKLLDRGLCLEFLVHPKCIFRFIPYTRHLFLHPILLP